MPRLETRLERIEAALVPAVVDITIRLTRYPCESDDAIHRRAEHALGRKQEPNERLIILTFYVDWGTHQCPQGTHQHPDDAVMWTPESGVPPRTGKDTA
jgi:metal-sulfur cluster biosynthetic enzyme